MGRIPIDFYSYGYSLEECRERKSAEKVARRALAINKKSPFAIHAMGASLNEIW